MTIKCNPSNANETETGEIALTVVLPAVESNFEPQNRDKVLSDLPSKCRGYCSKRHSCDTFGLLV
jgi:hypothetical protein